jgi:autotransporter-associated beta strand protein
MKNCRWFMPVIGFMLGLIGICSAGAATVNNWDVPGSGSWNNPANWTSGSIPSTNDDVQIGPLATSVTFIGSITLDGNQTAYGLTLVPDGAKEIHIDPGTSTSSTLTLVSGDPASADGINQFVALNALGGFGNFINVPLRLGNGSSGSFTAVINTVDAALGIGGGISQSPGQTWGVQITGNGQGAVDLRGPTSTYGGDTTITTTGILQLNGDNALPSGVGFGNVILQHSANLRIASANETIDGLISSDSGSTVTDINAQTASTLQLGANNATATFAGSILDPSTSNVLNVVKLGTGAQNLTGTLNWRGTTTIQHGTLLIDGTHSGAGNYTTLTEGATLGGIGTIDLASGSSVTVSTGRLSPGDNGPGVLNINGNLNLSSVGQLVVELGGNLPGDGPGFYDQVNMISISGAINSFAAHMSISLVNGFVPKHSDIFYILTRADSLAFSSTQPFDAITEGKTINIGNEITAQVTYKANWTGNQATSTLTGGNDMALYNFVVVPEPAAAVLLGIGAVMVGGISFCSKRS